MRRTSTSPVAVACLFKASLRRPLFALPASMIRGLVAACAAILLLSGPALAADDSSKHFEIKAKPLADALMEFGAQSGLTVAAPSTLTTGKRSASVRGDLSPMNALGQLLKGSGLTFARVGDGTIAIQAGRSGDPVRNGAAESSLESEVTAGPALQEILVTATRREENVSKVPISITAFTQDDMDTKGVRDFLDIARFTPGVTIDPTGTNSISIRGISSSGGAGTTGIYLDDTPIQVRAIATNPVDALPKTFDIERVEVLRGPQGTLFGAGSEGGTVRYILTQPSLTEFSDYLRSEVSYTQGGAPSYETGLALGGPIVTDTLGFRISAWFRRDGGWIDRADPNVSQQVVSNSNHDEATALRAALTWQPISGVKITPSFFSQYLQQNDVNSYWPAYSNPGNNNFVNGNPGGLYEPDRFELTALKVTADLGPVQLINNTSYFRRRDISGYDGTTQALEFYQTLGWLPGAGGNAPGSDPYAGTSPCAPHGFNCYPLVDGNGVHLPAALANYRAPASVTNNQDNITQELRLQSTDPAARVVWTAGAFFSIDRTFSLEAASDPMIDPLFEYLYGTTAADVFGTATNPNGSTYLPRGDSFYNQLTGHDRQVAGFGEAVWSLTDQWKLTTGLRYSKTEYSFQSISDGPDNGGPNSAAGTQNQNPLTKRAGLSFQADPNNLFYFMYSTGFRVGGSNESVPFDICKVDLDNFGLKGVPPSYNSDTVTSYEIGSKNNFGNRVKLAASLYYINWNGIQQTVQLPNCGLLYVTNLGTAVSKGGDLQADFAVTDYLTLESAIGYTDAYYSKGSPPGPLATTLVSAKGDAIIGQSGNAPPPWTITLGAEYGFRAFGGHESFVRIDVEHQTKNNRPTSLQDPNTLQYAACPQVSGVVTVCTPIPSSTTFVSLRAGADFGGWNVSAFVDNLLDSHPVLSQQSDGPDASGPQPGVSVLNRDFTFRPRTIGITLTHRSK
jgi:iron complex outermembrane recepter protein